MKARQVLVLLVAFLPLSLGDKCSKLAKEGSIYTFVETFKYSELSNMDNSLVWKTRMVTTGFNIVLLQCIKPTSSAVTSCEDKASFPGQYSGTIQRVDGGYKTVMTINTVTRPRDETTLLWVDSDDESTPLRQCDLDIYAIKSDPVCQDIQLDSQAGSASWVCSISNIYPKPLCQFEYKKDNQNYQQVPSDHITKGTPTPSGSPVYYSMSCTMNVPASTLQQPGTYTFKVTMYPTGISPSLADLESDSVTLSLPVASTKDCPSGSDVKDGYIKEGTTATCQCYLTHVGIPPGQPQWVNAEGQQVGQLDGSGSLSLTVGYVKDDVQSPYTCRGSSSLGDQSDDVKTFTPQFAYGPSYVSISINEESVKDKIPNFNLCKSTDTFPVTCDMASNTVNPKPNVQLEGIDKNSITPTQETNPVNTYRYKYTVTPKTGGTLTLQCVATNSIFPDLIAHDEETITIQAPPSSPPTMTTGIVSVVNGVATVTSGQRLVVKCRVDGGYPAVSKVTTTCVGLPDVVNGVETTQTLVIDKDMNQKKCVCRADHVTGCYDKTSQFTLNVQSTTEPFLVFDSTLPPTTTTPAPRETDSPIHHDFFCDITHMSIHIPISLLPNSKLTLKDPVCVLKKVGTNYVLDFKFDECGSSVAYFTDVVYISNEINVHKDLGSFNSPIVLDTDFKIPLKCSLNRTALIEGGFQTVTREPIIEIEDNSDKNKYVLYTLREFKTAAYKEEITDYPVQIPINREIFMELSVNESKAGFGIEIERCYATPTADPKDSTSYTLLAKGCPASAVVHMIPSSTTRRRRFKVQAFHFGGAKNDHDKVYIHCQVHYCTQCETDDECSNRRKRSLGRLSSSFNKPRYTRRARGNERNIAVSLGPIEVL